MDLLFKRYASPFFLIDQILLTGNFEAFVSDLFDIVQEERTWEFYLHKIKGKSFEEFKRTLNDDQNNFEMSKEQIETTVNDSFEILQGFIPADEKG